MFLNNFSTQDESCSFESPEPMDLREMIHHGREAFDALIDNQYIEGFSMVDRYARESFYHAMGKAILLSLRFGFTFKADIYKRAWEATRYALKKIEKNRHHRSLVENASSYIIREDYSDWTDTECHAELTFAEMSAAFAAFMVVNDRSMSGLVKSAMKIRQCHQTYKECKNILKYRKKWEDLEMKDHFKSGVLLGLGLFDMAISFFPSSMIKLLEIAGFSGNRTVGMDLLMECAQLTHTIRYPVVSVALSGYFGFGEFFYGLGEPDTECIYRILEYWEPRAPESIAVKMGKAFKASWEGNFEDAVRYYDEYIQAQNIAKALHYFAYWQIIWIHSCQWDWERACERAKFMMEQCRWSPSMFHYIYASMLSMKIECAEKDVDQEQLEEMRQKMMYHFKKAVQLKRTFGGRRAFHEKLVAEKAKSFIRNPDKIVFAPLDLMYLWNSFAVAARNPDCLANILFKIEGKMSSYPKESNLETYSYLNFMKGVTLSTSYPLTAIGCFFELLDYEKELKKTTENHLIPQACFEVGQIYRRTGDYTEAKKWYKKAKSYGDYMTDALIKFRIDAAFKVMKDNDNK